MKWLCFGESARGVLVCGRHEIDGPTLSSERILCLTDNAAIGDPGTLLDADARAFVFAMQYGDRAQEMEARHFDALHALTTDEAPVVIWYGDNAAERCGLLFAVSVLAASRIPIWLAHVDGMPDEAYRACMRQREEETALAVCVLPNSTRLNRLPGVSSLQSLPYRLPGVRRLALRRLRRQVIRRRMGQDGVTFHGTGELCPPAVPWFWERRHLLTEDEIDEMCWQWEALTQEHAPLRVLSRGKVCSVPEEHFDPFLLEQTPLVETPCALVIGRVLMAAHISDAFLYHRIRCLAARGEIQIVRDGPEYRDVTICRARG